MTTAPDDLVALRVLPGIEVLERDAARFKTHDAVTMAAFLTFTITAAAVQAEVEASLAEAGLSRGRFMVLICLRHCEGARSTPASLAAMATVTRATMTGLVDGLVRSGLVKRAHSESDRRSIEVSLSAKGHALLDRILPRHYARLAAMMSALGPRERVTLVKLLDKLRAGIEAPKESRARTKRRARPE
jgi:DNA-binding MarR family transcriptional regulator